MALKLSGSAFAAIMGASIRAVRYHELAATDPAHRCMRPAYEQNLRAYLEPRSALLTLRGIAYPWPEDIAPTIEICPKCSHDVREHQRCIACNVLVGAGHMQIAEDPKYCQVCYGYMPQHRRAGGQQLAAVR